MQPITGVFNSLWQSNPEGPNNVIRNFGVKYWYRQRKPYNLPLAYEAVRGNNTVRWESRGGEFSPASGFDSGFQAWWRPFHSGDFSSGDPMASFMTGLRDDALNRALVRFNAKRGEMASLGVTLAETSKTTQMIERRARQTLSIVNSLRKMRLGEAARQLGISPGTVRKKARDLSGLQLEISFGWMPFIADMYNAVKVLNAPIPYGVTRGAATVKQDYVVLGDYLSRATHKVVLRAYVAALLEVERPDLELASRLGLTNLPAIAFELIPWSFVGNWVFNFEEYLASFQDYPGIKVTNPHYGIKISDDFAMVRHQPVVPSGLEIAHQGGGYALSFKRSVGSLPDMKFGLRPSVNLGFSRALNAISLLVQKGIRGR